MSRFNRLGLLEDLEKAIHAIEEALESIPTDHPTRSATVNDLTGCYYSRYRRVGVLGDLDKVFQVGEEVLAATPLNLPDRVDRLANLSVMFHSRFERLGGLQDLADAVQAGEDALAASPISYSRRATLLSSLAGCLHSVFNRLGDLDDLEYAIRLCEEAEEYTPKDHPDRAGRLTNLSTVIFRRAVQLGALDDIQNAIRVGERALEITPLNHPDKVGRLNLLGVMLHCRFTRLGMLDDIENAIRLSRESVAATASDHAARPHRLACLSNQLHSRFSRLGVVDDIEQAIEVMEKALAGIPSDNPGRAERLSNLSYMIYKRLEYLKFDDLNGLDGAVVLCEEAITLTSDDDPSHANQLFLLAGLKYSLFNQSNSKGDFEQSLEMAIAAWNCDIAPPRIRIRAARFAASRLSSASRWAEAFVILEGAVAILPNVTAQFMGRDDQEHVLSEFNQFPAEVISIALQAGSSAFHCLQLLELSRGIIMGFAINCRSDLSNLHTNHPHIFDMFNQLRVEIDAPLVNALRESGVSTDEDRRGDEGRRRRRVEAINKFDEMTVEIRKRRGFEEFHLPPSSDHLMEMAVEGPIIIYNSTKIRSDAIIVTSFGIQAVPLPQMVFSEVEDRMKRLAQLTHGKRHTYTTRNEDMEKVLLWLWEVAVEPVFTELGFGVVVDDKIPRVWWIGIGLLAQAPFHAAGNHSRRSTRNTLSRAISSYTPTIKALSYARQKKLELRLPVPRLLLVAMPTTPDSQAIPAVAADFGKAVITSPLRDHAHHPSQPFGALHTLEAMAASYPAMYQKLAVPGAPAKKWKPLKNAIAEVREIMCIVQEVGDAMTTRMDSPTITQVLLELPAHQCIHFACHGVSDGENPSGSHLLLHGDNPVELGKLTVSAISNINIKNAQVAYLSACCTADNPSSTLADEVIHIANGFQLAGFSHVLATLWESDDDACRQVSGEFYRLLFDPRQNEQGHGAVSFAFHHAVKKLRHKLLGQPIKWASFIHTGA